MFMVVVGIFAICWLPYHVYFIYTYHDKEVVTKPYIQHVYLSFYWLAMANAMVNPAIYYGMNARYLDFKNIPTVIYWEKFFKLYDVVNVHAVQSTLNKQMGKVFSQTQKL